MTSSGPGGSTGYPDSKAAGICRESPPISDPTCMPAMVGPIPGIPGPT